MMPSSLGGTTILSPVGALSGCFLSRFSWAEEAGISRHDVFWPALSFAYRISARMTACCRLFRGFPRFIGTASPQVFLLGPLVFLYIRSCLRHGRGSWAGSAAHLAPFAVALVIRFSFFLAFPGSPRFCFPLFFAFLKSASCLS